MFLQQGEVATSDVNRRYSN